jgi:hypothetical protein
LALGPELGAFGGRTAMLRDRGDLVVPALGQHLEK